MAWSDAARRAAIEARRRKRMVTMYHGTSSSAAKRILKEGFRPRGNERYSKEWYADSPRTATYLTTHKTWAKTFAARAAFETGAKSGGVVLKVRVPVRKVRGEGGPFYYTRGVARQRIISVERLKRKGHIWEHESSVLREIRRRSKR